MTRIAIVAGETSGDMLGAGLIAALRKRFPDAEFEGIGGPLMQAQGFESLFPMERLAVMGLVEVLGRLFELLSIRKQLIRRWLENPPDVMIGIDAPDFNLTLEESLRAKGVRTVHYVSPSVWAWREKRVLKIERAVDLMLTLFPFEARFYEQHKVPVRFVGHHLADKIALETPKRPARGSLDLDSEGPLVCLMPGSRGSEVGRLGSLFLETAQLMLQKRPDLQFVIPAANAERMTQLQGLLDAVPYPLPVKLVQGQSHTCMAAADAILLASGTATLEAMLLKRPMVVSYKVAPLTYHILKRLVRQPWVSLPNLLAGRELVPEVLQDEATPSRLSALMLSRLEDSDSMNQLHETFLFIHRQLQRHADEEAAKAIAGLIQSH
ncbi:lipid-A-disaccharide synthase [Parathalassolituus penaei]|uniref:Lipid-A-disaccharide synthase n=1 Tax=Parathalassolituus penaei TaxID=2997323 RepID=A0A9X3ECG5_9GAMM|nr:lipid-A-disaccharide synthase [Parathalassolituus penaei]MCY0964105.1 lipid-A-disaccharide synthase [Parathalassolituus penaei]